MRNKLLALVTSMTVWLGSSTAAAQVAAEDSVTGSASFSDPGPPAFQITFSFNAHSGPLGENAGGTADWAAMTPFGDFGGGGTVTCLNVRGSEATIGTFADGRTTFFFVSGTIGFGSFDAATAPTVCPSGPGGQPFSQFFEPRAMDNNSVVIVDAPPLPTAKDQCKSSGWQNFPGFKNRGECVSFVATKGKNPPVGH